MDQEQTPHSPTRHSRSPPSSASGSTSAEPVRSRWSPKPEQILILESIFHSGMVNPPKEETVRIRKMLEKFGAVGDANVFYWFQNRRSRSRRRQRQLQAAAAAADATTNTSSSSSSYGGGCDNQSNSGMENLLTMSGQMSYHEATHHHYQNHSSNVTSILCPSDQNSNFQYQQGCFRVGKKSILGGFQPENRFVFIWRLS
ncbi:hypothetical protein [Arabidopsis thaliana]|nr:hypothetical protein [Arabidopsis thaliana]